MSRSPVPIVVAALVSLTASGLERPASSPLLVAEPRAEAATVSYPAGAPLDPAPHAALAAFFAKHSASWDVLWDARTHRPQVIQGIGFPLIPGRGNALPAGPRPQLADVERLLRAFMGRFPELFRVRAGDLVLDASGSTPFGEDEEIWLVEFQQTRHGIPIDGAKVYFRINHGNVVQLGADGVIDVRIDTTPRIPRSAALETAIRHLGASADEIAAVLDAGTLKIAPGEDRHRLVWDLTFRRRGDVATYNARVDAHDGHLVRLVDVNGYAQVTGGIYPATNTGPEEIRPFPFATLTNGATKTTDAYGSYDYTGGAATIALDGQFARIVDTCGAISLSDAATGNLAFGASAGTDCATPGIGGAGNTHASRSAFYHVTTANRKAASYLPGNAWLAAKLQVNTNVNATCNAAYDGIVLNLYRSGGGCSNTGEIAAVVHHEWGHGLDSNTGGVAPDRGSGEAVGDTVALVNGRDGCIGHNFTPGVNCHNCNACTGVRDVSDFDLSGPGVIARPSTITDNAGINCDRFVCPQLAAGPMGYQSHCESYIAASANWDLSQLLVAAHGVEAGWGWMEKIFYGSLVPSKSAYRITSGGQCNPAAGIDGCGATNWYTVYLAVDDDNGNLADGTPNACRIWDAFDAHGIACGPRPACSAATTCASVLCPLPSCAPPLPAVAACPIETLAFASKTDLTWSPPAGCALPAAYDTVRADLDCLHGTCRPLAQVGPSCLPLENDGGDTVATDATLPAAGEGFLYLVRVDDGTWNGTGTKQCTDHDATLPLGCP